MISNFKKIISFISLFALIFAASTTNMIASEKLIHFSEEHTFSLSLLEAAIAFYGFTTAGKQLIKFIKHAKAENTTIRETVKTIGKIIAGTCAGLFGTAVFMNILGFLPPHNKAFIPPLRTRNEIFLFCTTHSFAGIIGIGKTFQEGLWFWKNRNETHQATNETRLTIPQRAAKLGFAAFFAAHMFHLVHYVVRESLK